MNPGLPTSAGQPYRLPALFRGVARRCPQELGFISRSEWSCESVFTTLSRSRHMGSHGYDGRPLLCTSLRLSLPLLNTVTN